MFYRLSLNLSRRRRYTNSVAVSARHLSFLKKRKESDNVEKVSKTAQYGRILNEVKPVKNRILGACGLSLVSSGIMMSIPYGTGHVIDQATRNNDLSWYCDNMLMVGLGIFGVQFAANLLRQYYVNTSANIVTRRLRERTHAALLNKDIAYYDQHQSGSIVSRLSSDCQVIGSSATVNLNDGFRAIIQFSISTFMIMKMAPAELLAVSAGGVVVIMATSRVCGGYIKQYTAQQQKWTAEASRIAQERFAAIRTVRAFGHDAYERDKYGALVGQVQAATEKEARAQSTLFSFNPFMGNVLLVYILMTSVPYIQAGVISPGDVTGMLLYSTFSGISLASFGNFYASMNKAVGASDRIWRILDEPASVIGGAKRINQLEGRIDFDNVSFAYPTRPDELILNDISLSVPADSTLAVVGKSGSGKSTIAKLLFQFYQPTKSGDARTTSVMTLDGHDFAELDYHWLRGQMAMVPQDPELFADSIRNNILYGATEDEFASISDDEIIEMARKSNAWEFIEKLPRQLDTEIGERGVLLSGGQRQRLVIARALLRRPRILILDEATSALDAESEQLVQRAIDNLAHEKMTLIIIAHRLATIKNADQIVVLDGGRVIEQGTFDELVAETDSVFSDLVARQRLS